MPNPFALAEAFVSITGDDRPLSLKISDAKLKVDELAKKSATITIKGDNKEAQLALDDTRLKLLKLSQTTARPNINVQGIARADLELDKLSLKLDKLNAKSVSPLVKLGKSGALAPSLGGAALALSPSLIPLAGAVAGAVGAIGISFGIAGAAAVGFGALARTVLTDAGTDATKLAALNVKLNAATTTSAKDAIKAQIAALEQGWTPAYKQVMSGLASLKTGWKALAIQVAAPVIAPWLDVLNRALPLLKDGLQPVADLFKSWGQSLDKYFSNPVTVLHLKDIAATLGSFAAIQLGQIGKFLADIATAFFNLGKDIPAGTQLGAAGTDLAKIGDSFLTWSKSKAARDDVHGFFKFIHDDGGTVKTILKDLGTILPGIFKGASTVGTLELQAIAGFLTLIAKLPKGWQAPLTEAAGAMLLLAKTGVLKVGITLVGTAAKLISGGTLALGGTAAAAEMRAAFATGGAAAAAEIRAAMVGGGAAGGATGAAESAAGGAAAGAGSKFKVLGIGWGALLAAGLIIGVNQQLPVIHKSIWQLGNPPAAGQQGNFLDSWSAFGKGLIDSFHAGALAASAKQDWKQVVASAETSWHSIVGSVQGDVAGVETAWDSLRRGTATRFDAIRGAIAAAWSTIWTNTRNTVAAGISAVVGFFTGRLRPGISSAYITVRNDIAGAWSTIWTNTRSVVSTGISAVVTFFKGLPGKVVAALTGLGHSLGAFAAAALTEMLNGFKRIAGDILSWLGGFVGKIIGLVGKLLKLGSPSGVFFDIGVNMMKGLELGIKARAHHVANAAKSATSGAVGALGGPTSASAAQAQSYARSRLSAYGWGAGQMTPLIALWNQESGWNRFATNPSSGAYGIPQALPPGKMGAAANPPTSSAAAQINWGLGYIKDVYGSPAGAEAHELNFHWYDQGGWLPPRSATVAVNATGRPERVVSGAGEDKLLTELRHIKHLLSTGNALTARAPSQIGYGLGRGLNQATQRAVAHGAHSVSRPIA